MAGETPPGVEPIQCVSPKSLPVQEISLRPERGFAGCRECDEADVCKKLLPAYRSNIERIRHSGLAKFLAKTLHSSAAGRRSQAEFQCLTCLCRFIY